MVQVERRIVLGDVQRHVFAHTTLHTHTHTQKNSPFIRAESVGNLGADIGHLDQVVEHEGGDAGAAPLGMREEVRHVGLVVGHVGHHEREADDQVAVEHHAAKVRILQALGHCRNQSTT